MGKIDLKFAKRNGLDETINNLHALTNDSDDWVKRRAYRGLEIYEEIAKGEYDRLELSSYVNETRYLTNKSEQGLLTPSEMKCYKAEHLASLILINQLFKEQAQLTMVIKQMKSAGFPTQELEKPVPRKKVGPERIGALSFITKKHPADLLWKGYKENPKYLSEEINISNFESQVTTNIINVINSYRERVKLPPLERDYDIQSAPSFSKRDILYSLPKIKLTTSMLTDYLLNEYIFKNMEIMEAATRFRVIIKELDFAIRDETEYVQFIMEMKLLQ